MSRCFNCLEDLEHGNLCETCYSKLDLMEINWPCNIFVNKDNILIYNRNSTYYAVIVDPDQFAKNLNEKVLELIRKYPDVPSISLAINIANDIKRKYPKEIVEKIATKLSQME